MIISVQSAGYRVEAVGQRRLSAPGLVLSPESGGDQHYGTSVTHLEYPEWHDPSVGKFYLT